MKTYFRHGFLISRNPTPCALRWRGWAENGVTFRADTLKGAFKLARAARATQ